MTISIYVTVTFTFSYWLFFIITKFVFKFFNDSFKIKIIFIFNRRFFDSFFVIFFR
jgi:hypothetical protein